ncbi:MAG: amino acid ABC transporter permease [Helicobacter sp.]|nr:amino acid ABC transporter permease [Helicobacter sp.]
MDFAFMLRFAPEFGKGIALTLWLTALGILFSVAIGVLCVLLLHFKRPFLSRCCRFYIEISRNTPLLIQLFFLYYGLPKIGIALSSFTCAVIGLGFLGGSYMAESLRSGLESVRPMQIQSGMSLGLSEWQNLYYVILPQALAVAMPSLSANIIFLLKETSVVSIIALADVVYKMTELNSIYYKTDELLLMLFLCYLVMILPLSLFLGRLEKRLARV